MKQVAYPLGIGGSLFFWCLVASVAARAQISPDGTLPTQVEQSGRVTEITGGETAGGNLFHSFREFSVPNGSEAFFNNNVNIANIISRVTGGSISNIDGLIRANGSANLILINPSGIQFGANARLNIGGSFLGTTANSLEFADGTLFSATAPQTPLLTVSVPVGLQFGQNPGAIAVQNVGHNLTLGTDGNLPVERSSANLPRGLSVRDGQTLALIGGNLTLEGGILRVGDRGRIELGSVGQGRVSLNELPSQGWRLGYEGAQSFQNIQFNSASLADLSGNSGGSIQLQGARITIADGSAILLQNLGADASSIEINATEAVEVRGTSSREDNFSSAIATETYGIGKGGDIAISSGNLAIRDGAVVYAATYGNGRGGNAKTNTTGSMVVDGVSAQNRNRESFLGTLTSNAARSGDLTLNARGLTVSSEGQVATLTLGTGNGGNLNVNASESVLVIGGSAAPNSELPSSLGTLTSNTGSSGDFTLTTPQLTVRDGGLVGALTFGTGDGGNLSIDATESVLISGTSPSFRSSLGSYTDNVGNAGDTTITTQQLTVEDGAQLLTATFGAGQGGELSINASESVVVSGAASGSGLGSTIGSFSAGTGNAGYTSVSAKRLTVRDGGTILSSTFGTGNAGNLFVNAREFVEVIGKQPENSLPSLISSSANITGENRQLPRGDAADVNIDTDRLLVTDGAQIAARNEGAGSAGNINISARSILLDNEGAIAAELGGTTIGGRVTIFSPQTRPSGKSGDLTIATEQLAIRNGGSISTATFTDATGGNITVDAAESVEVSGTSPKNPNLLSFISASTYGSADSGNINLSTGRLTIQNGAIIGAGSFATGAGKDVIINATESVEVIGVTSNQAIGSLLGVSTLGAGDAGNLSVNAPRVVVRDGGRIDASTAATGDAGSITINARESVEVSGVGAGNLTSLISSAANLENEITRQIFNLPPIPSGNSGNVMINTGRLDLANGAQVTARNEGLGDAGRVEIKAGSIFLNNFAGITASTVAGRGGSINVQVGDVIEANGSSFITNLNGGTQTAGDLTIDTGRLLISDGSFVATTALGAGRGGNLSIRASESVEIVGNGFEQYQRIIGNFLSGNATLANIRNGLFTGAANRGAAGDLTIDTQRLTLREGGVVSTNTLGAGNGGDIAIKAPQGVELSGSGFASLTSSSGDAGRITIDTNNLLVRDGAAIATSTFGSGAGGALTVNASERVELRQTPTNTITPTGLFTNSILGTGDAGDLTVNTQTLVVRDGAQLSAQSGGVTNSGILTSRGAGGNLTVNASDSIDVTGRSPDGLFRSALSTTTFGEAAAGNLQIVTGQLSVQEGAAIGVTSLGTGNAGTLEVTAESILLDDRSLLSAETASGQGGNINLQVRDSIQVNGNSEISSTARGSGNGGNLIIDTGNFLVLLDRSRLSANAIAGRGGNINIDGRGLFICGDCQISATSELGIDGVVDISTLDPDNQLEVVDLPQEVANPEQVVALSCQSQRGQQASEFIVTGRGGLPPRPSEPLGSEALVPFAPTVPVAESASDKQPESVLPPPARGWYVSAKGTVVLADRSPHNTPHSSGLISSQCHAE